MTSMFRRFGGVKLSMMNGRADMHARIPSRSFASAVDGIHVYRKKSFKEDWLSDTGTWPIIAVMACAGVLAGGFMVYHGATNPDARWAKSSRKSIFRGELKDLVAQRDDEGIRKALGIKDVIARPTRN